jgi:hypothetical protein
VRPQTKRNGNRKTGEDRSGACRRSRQSDAPQLCRPRLRLRLRIRQPRVLMRAADCRFSLLSSCLYRAGSAPPETAASDHTAHHRCRNHRSLRRAGGANQSHLAGDGKIVNASGVRTLSATSPRPKLMHSAASGLADRIRAGRSGTLNGAKAPSSPTPAISFFPRGGGRLSSGVPISKACRRPPDTAWRHAEVSWARCASDTVISLMGQNRQLPELREMRQATVFYVFGL